MAEPLSTVAQRIAEMRLGHPVRVAVDGRTGCGKSTFADSLAAEVRASGRRVIRATIDDFHQPAAIRHWQGRYSPEGYYRDARDLDAIVTLLLRPLGPGGSLRLARRSFDLSSDRPLEPEFESAGTDDVLIVDGTFLQRPELRDHFDFAVFLDTPREIARERATRRDAKLVGGLAEAEKLYDLRYAPAFDLYLRDCDPISLADAAVS